jgi:hypothetical protein
MGSIVSSIGSSLGSLGGLFGAGSGLGSLAQIGANGLAANAQTAAGNAANTRLQPYQQTGLAANTEYANLLGVGPQGSAGIQSTLNNLPGYQFQRGQALSGINNQASAMGLGSNALMGAGAMANNIAGTNYQSYLGNLLSATNLGANVAQEQGQNTIGIGNAQAGSYLRSGNALSGGLMSPFGASAINSGINPSTGGALGGGSGSGAFGSGSNLGGGSSSLFSGLGNLFGGSGSAAGGSAGTDLGSNAFAPYLSGGSGAGASGLSGLGDLGSGAFNTGGISSAFGAADAGGDIAAASGSADLGSSLLAMLPDLAFLA